MPFNSLAFIIFLPITIALYFACPFRFRWILLLVASYAFYMAWEPAYVVLMIAATLINYLAARMMAASPDGPLRNAWFVSGIVATLSILLFFKYFNFLNDSIRSIFMVVEIPYPVPAIHFLLPIGISFYTFQSLGYLIDVYRRERAPETHLGIFALFISFFPQLVAGPIERSDRLLPQFFQKNTFDYDRAVSGLRLILWGFFQKIVIADRLAIAVDAVYANPREYSAASLVIATVFFAFQVFCDFSAYSDIAIGSARIMGYDLMVNFKRPFFATSIREFWRRWHISLSTWFRDYLYFPLGGNQFGLRRWAFNLMITFLLCGLWHGAAWTTVLWGGIHGFYMVFSRLTWKIRESMNRAIGLTRLPRLHNALKMLCVFALFNFSLLVFRSHSVGDAVYIIHKILASLTGSYADAASGESILQIMGVYDFAIALITIALMESVHVLQTRMCIRDALRRINMPVRWGIYIALIFSIILLGKIDTIQFFYFQF